MMTASGWTARLLALALVAAPALAETRPQPRPASLVEIDTPTPELTPMELPDDAKTAAAKPEAPRDPNRGSVTTLPLPRYVSLKGNEGNARRGPGLTHRIDWVFTRSGMPLRITAEYEHWRRVEDSEGVGGWVNFVLLSGVRTALVTQDMAEFHTLPDANAPVSFQAETGVVGKILTCEPDWCRLNVDGNRGWVQKAALWGVDPGEIIE